MSYYKNTRFRRVKTVFKEVLNVCDVLCVVGNEQNIL